MDCVLYARVSTDKQAEKELSIPAQLEAMREYARQRSWRVLVEFVEPGASARTVDRPELQRLLSYIREAQVGVVLVHKIDRLARNVYDHATIKALLQQRGTRLASVVENMDDTVSGQLVENIMASIAQFYSANLAEEVRKGMRQKVANGGWPHKPPRGYVAVRARDGQEARIEFHHRDGPLMRRAFELYATGWYSMRVVASRLAGEGLVASNGGPIPQAHMRRLLANPFYVGRVRWQELDVQGNHPPLVTDALFAKVQAAILRRFRDPGVKGTVRGFPLRGLAICAHCRGRMTAERRRRWGYYRCSRRTYRKEACSSRYCNADRTHAALKEVCLGIRLGRETTDAIMRAAQAMIHERAATSDARAARLQARTAELLAEEMGLAEAFSDGELPPKAYASRTADIRREKLELAAQARSGSVGHAKLAERVAKTLQVATSLWDLYEQLEDGRRSELLRTVFKTVVLDRAGIAGFTLKPPFDRLALPHGPRRRTPQQMAKAILEAA